jgi:prephenate dehydratase/chorismate mutase
MGLKEIRSTIDSLDSQILKLLNERMEQAIMAIRFKKKIEDTGREKAMLQKIRENSRGLVNADFCEKLFVEIITESKRLQDQNSTLVAFQGEHGAYSEIALRKWNNNIVAIPCKNYNRLFEGLQNGQYDYAVIPVENTMGRLGGQVNDLMVNHKFSIIASVNMSVNLCLMGLPGTKMREIKSVYSHPDTLSQCSRFLLENDIEQVPFGDTAGAAKFLSEEKRYGSGAIASPLTAEIYKLDILQENLEDLEVNRTRFLILARDGVVEEGSKCSIFFSIEHKSGTLNEALNCFSNEGINLTKIESIPDTKGDYLFFMDFAGSDKYPSVQRALDGMKKFCRDFTFLGCYNELMIDD